MTDVTNAALQYANRGYPVFPLKERSKVPLEGTHGFHDATTDLGLIQSMFPDGVNLAIRTGAGSGDRGLFVLDIDPDKGGAESLSKLIEEHGNLPTTPTQKTGRGGFHHLFAMPRGVTIKCRSEVLPGIDIRGDGGYIVAAPSIHENGVQYEWIDGSTLLQKDPSEPPQWLVDIAAGKLNGVSLGSSAIEYDEDGEADEFDRRDIISALSVIDADSSFEDFCHGKSGYDVWRDIGMAIAYEFGMKDGYQVWLDWCERGSKGKFKNLKAASQWSSYNPEIRLNEGIEPVTRGTIFSVARDCFGWDGEVQPTIDLESFLSSKDKQKNDDPEDAKELEPIEGEISIDRSDILFERELLGVEGILGVVADWIKGNGFMSPHELALAGSISLISALAGRSFTTPTGGGLGLYIIGIAPSSAGKNAAITMISNLLLHAGLGDYLGGASVTGDSAIHDALLGHPSQLMIWDEIGEKLGAMTDSKKGSRMMGAIEKLLSVWSSGSGILPDKAMSSRGGHSKKREDIVEPNLALYGVSTPSALGRSLKKGDVTNGFLPRFLLVGVDKTPRPNMNASESPPESIVSYVRNFMKTVAVDSPSFTVSGMDTGIKLNPAVVKPKKKVIPWGLGAEVFFGNLFSRYLKIQEQFDKLGDDLYSAVYGKLGENCLRLASLYAISVNPSRPIVTPDALRWAQKIVEKSCATMHKFCSAMTDSQFEADVVRVEEIIKNYMGAGNRGIQSRILTRKTRWLRHRERKEILHQLCEAGLIQMRKDGKKTFYVHLLR